MQQRKCAVRGAFGEHLGQLVAQTLRGNRRYLRCELLNRQKGPDFDSIAKARGEANRAQKAQSVFRESLLRVTDRPENSGAQVPLPSGKIQYLAGSRIHHHSIDGEIAPGYILLRRLGKNHLVGVATIGITDVGAKRRNFYLMAMFNDDDDAKLRANQDPSGE